MHALDWKTILTVLVPIYLLELTSEVLYLELAVDRLWEISCSMHIVYVIFLKDVDYML